MKTVYFAKANVDIDVWLNRKPWQLIPFDDPDDIPIRVEIPDHERGRFLSLLATL